MPVNAENAALHLDNEALVLKLFQKPFGTAVRALKERDRMPDRAHDAPVVEASMERLDLDVEATGTVVERPPRGLLAERIYHLHELLILRQRTLLARPLVVGLHTL